MAENSDQRQSWLGLIATLVCILILFALVAPAVQDSDRRTRNNECQLRLKSLVQSTLQYEASHACYPTYQSAFGGTTGGPVKIGAWIVSLLPYLDQQQLRDIWDNPEEQDNWAEASVRHDVKQMGRFYTKLNLAICPQDLTLKDEHAPLSYVPNTGFYMLGSDPALGLDIYRNTADASERSTVAQRIQNGLFANGLPARVVDPKSGALTTTFGPVTQKHKSKEVRDGLSQTVAFFENNNSLNWREYSIEDESARYKLGCVWLYAGDSTTEGRPQAMTLEPVMRINFEKNKTSISPKRARPNSFHPEIANAAMADGSVVAIAEAIDYHIYQALMTPQTRQSDAPNNMHVLKDEDYLP